MQFGKVDGIVYVGPSGMYSVMYKKKTSINISAISWSTDFYKNARALLYAS